MATLRFQVTEIKTVRFRVTHEVDLEVNDIQDLSDAEGEIRSLMDSGCSDEVGRDELDSEFESDLEEIIVIN